MVIPEWAESFVHDGRELAGMFTEFDENAPAGQPGMITRVYRVLVTGDDAARLFEGSIILRVKTGDSYAVKLSRKSGVGLTEVDLARVDGNKFERRF